MFLIAIVTVAFIIFISNPFVCFSLYVLHKLGINQISIDLIRIHFLTDWYGRDKSHGYLHAWDVMSDALLFYKEDNRTKNDPKLIYLLSVVSLMHDVADGKYDADGSWKKIVEKFFFKHFNPDAKMLLDVINYSSYSKEVAFRKDHSEDELKSMLTNVGHILWIYLTSADRIQSLGAVGHLRSKQYNSKRLGKYINTREVFDAVSDIIQSKLHTLQNFIYSKSAASKAIGMTQELLDSHEQWRKDLGF